MMRHERKARRIRAGSGTRDRKGFQTDGNPKHTRKRIVSPAAANDAAGVLPDGARPLERRCNLNTPIPHPPRLLPTTTQTRLQHLLDEGDLLWFERHPGEPTRTRMHFKDERIEGDGEPSRYVVVTREGDRLVRRFVAEAEATG